jgi:hypothetical protein
MDGMTEAAMLDPETLARSTLVRRHMLAVVDAAIRSGRTLDVATVAADVAADFDLYADAACTKVLPVLFDIAAQVVATRSTSTPMAAVS